MPSMFPSWPTACDPLDRSTSLLTGSGCTIIPDSKKMSHQILDSVDPPVPYSRLRSFGAFSFPLEDDLLKVTPIQNTAAYFTVCQEGMTLTTCVIVANKVTDYVEENNLEYHKLTGIGTDGAAVMTGKVNGAVKIIIDRQTEKQKVEVSVMVVKAIGHHCAVHKLNLAASHAGNAFPVIARFKTILQQL